MDDITLTAKQEEALKLAVARYTIGMPYTVISGYAGSGKSTLVKFIISALNIPETKVAYIAYTGKAANVLKNKGCPNATTAHKLLYHARQTKTGNYIFTPKPKLDDDYDLIVVDEISMLPQELWYQLLSHGVHVLAMGDPGQLSPPQGETNPALDNPHVFLDEIMRQAQESAVIRLSMHIREGKDFRDFPTVSGEVRIIPHRWEFEDENTTLLQASQILCGTNAQRFELNDKVRKMLGRGPTPEPEDKIIGLKNHWNEVSAEGNALTNGAIGHIIPIRHEIQKYPTNLATFKDFKDTDILIADFVTDDGDTFTNLPIDYQCLVKNEPSLTGPQEYRLASFNKNNINTVASKRIKRTVYSPTGAPDLKIPYHFNYGYAITTWKAQGSEYPYILGYDCSWLRKKNKEEYIKYLYTLVTRAEKAVILVGD
jgi:exodeoxyribonuclease-5